MALNGDSTLLLAVALHGAGLSALLWRAGSPRVEGTAAVSRVNRIANRCLAALTMIAALRLMPYVLGYAGAYDANPWLTFAPFDFTLALGPLLWAYVTALTTGALPHQLRRHLVPAAVQALYFAACFALPLETKWSWYTGPHLRVIEPAGLGVVLVSLGAYGIAAWRRYAAHQDWLTDNVSNREEFRLGWLRLLLLAVASTWVVTAGFFVVTLTGRPLDYFDRGPAMLWLAGLVYALGLAGWRYGTRPLPLVDDGLRDESERAPSDTVRPSPVNRATARDRTASAAAGVETRSVPDNEPTAAAPTTDHRELAAEWERRTAAAGWWQDPMLTRTALARHLGTSPRTLSRVLNEGMGQTFNEFVNRLRVAAVAAELSDPSRERELLQIAFDAGFNSKASFNRVFKAFTGQTPSAFREARRRMTELDPARGATTSPSRRAP